MQASADASLAAAAAAQAAPDRPPQKPRPIQPDGKLHGVAVACQRVDGRYLLIRRSAIVSAPLAICFPGGGIELGETHHNAVIREMQEELGAAVEPGPCVWRWEPDDRPLVLFGYRATLLSPTLTPDPAEVAEVLWLTLDQAAQHPDGLASNALYANALRLA